MKLNGRDCRALLAMTEMIPGSPPGMTTMQEQRSINAMIIRIKLSYHGDPGGRGRGGFVSRFQFLGES